MTRCTLLLLAVLTAAPAHADHLILPAGRAEMGIFQPLRIGVSDTLEIDTFPLLAFVMPNVTARIGWSDALITEHAITYPTQLLRLLSREGTGGIMPLETKVPDILMIENLVHYRLALGRGQTVTFKGGAIIAGVSGPSTMPTIDLPLVYPRTAAWEDGITGRLGIDFDGAIGAHLYYNVDVDLFAMADSDAPFHVEHSLLAGWQMTWWVALQLGYKLVVGQYPFGTQVHILPMFDLNFVLHRERSHERHTTP